NTERERERERGRDEGWGSCSKSLPSPVLRSVSHSSYDPEADSQYRYHDPYSPAGVKHTHTHTHTHARTHTHTHTHTHPTSSQSPELTLPGCDPEQTLCSRRSRISSTAHSLCISVL